MIRSLLVLILLVAAGCKSGEGNAYEDTWEVRYKHSFDFMWEQAADALREQYAIASEDHATRTITTDWDVHLGVFSEKGFRTRLVVTLDGDIVKGYLVTVKEELEVNEEATNPELASEAEWKAGDADGGTAARFRIALHKRLNPSQKWRDVERR